MSTHCHHETGRSFPETQSTKHQKRQRVTTPRQDRHIVRKHLQNRTLPSVLLLLWGICDISYHHKTELHACVEAEWTPSIIGTTCHQDETCFRMIYPSAYSTQQHGHLKLKQRCSARMCSALSWSLANLRQPEILLREWSWISGSLLLHINIELLPCWYMSPFVWISFVAYIQY